LSVKKTAHVHLDYVELHDRLDMYRFISSFAPSHTQMKLFCFVTQYRRKIEKECGGNVSFWLFVSNNHKNMVWFWGATTGSIRITYISFYLFLYFFISRFPSAHSLYWRKWYLHQFTVARWTTHNYFLGLFTFLDWLTASFIEPCVFGQSLAFLHCQLTAHVEKVVSPLLLQQPFPIFSANHWINGGDILLSHSPKRRKILI
jgi:hypothetical protein